MASSIAQFYNGRSLFLTGGLGFIGKQVVEKMLRSCPEVENIYLLVRQKKGKSVEQRLKQTLESPVFDRLRHEQPNFHRKLIPIAGDVSNDFLGISDSDFNRMASKVSVVMHSAATLSFQEPLRIAVDMNVLGVKRMLSVCKELNQLDALVHISTGYAHVDKGQYFEAVIEEKVYDPPIAPDQVISMTREMTDEQLAELTPQLLKTHRRPNTYTFTKAIAEKLIEQERGNIPCCIVRPTIVSASCAEPFPGWFDNYTAANGIYAGVGLGFLRQIYVSPKAPNDIIPVDRVANALIASAWHLHTHSLRGKILRQWNELESLLNGLNRKGCNAVQVYNLTNTKADPVYDLVQGMAKNATRDPCRIMPWVGRQWTSIPHATSSKLSYDFFKDVVLPVRFRLMDMALKMSGKKPRMVKQYAKMATLQTVLTYFTRNGFNWSDKNARLMMESMNDIDKKEFNTEMNIDLEEYYRVWWQGFKKYVIKEKAVVEPAVTDAEYKPDKLTA